MNAGSPDCSEQQTRAQNIVTIANLTAKADLVLVELAGVIEEMANMLRKGAHHD